MGPIKHSVSISEEAFRALVPIETMPLRVDSTEFAEIFTFNVHGVILFQMCCFLPFVDQYWIQDIDA